MTRIEPDEARALLDALRPAREPEVVVRDFSVPNRLGAARTREVREALEGCLADLTATLSEWVRRPIGLALVDVSEADARAVLATQTDAAFALAFTLTKAKGSTPGWLLWSSDAATRAAEVAMGAALREETRTTPPSAVERKLLVKICHALAERATRALQLEIASPACLCTPDEFEDALNALGDADAQRLSVQIDVADLGPPCSLRLVLPGVLPATAPVSAPPAALPRHLGEVPVEIAAFLGSVDIPLSDLLALEVGDVIALGLDVGLPLTVHVEDRPCASAHWGLKDGREVLRLQELDLEFDEGA